MEYARSEKDRKGTVDGLNNQNDGKENGEDEREKGGFRWSKIF